MKQLFTQLDLGRKFLQHYLILSLLLVLLATGLGIAPAHATSLYEIPNLSRGESTWVIDQADVLSRVNESQLSSTLKNLAQQTGNEVRLVTIRHLDYGETIESFTDKLFEKWYSTPEDQAHQTLIAIDTVSNNLAIRTGEAVKTLMPEDTAQSVITQTIGVPLRNGNKYNQAFLDASDRLVAILSGESDPGPPIEGNTLNTESTFASAEETDDRNAAIWVIGLLVVATVIPMATYFAYQAFS